MLKRTLLSAAALLVLALPAQAQQKVKIGYVNTFSGPTAMIGEDERWGFELALDHIGRKMGGLDVEVVFADDQMKPDVGKQVTEKLIQSDKVHFLTGYNWSNVLLASLKPAVDSQTFLISGNAGPSPIAGELCSPWFFSASWQNDQTAMAMGEAMNKKGIKKLFVLAPNYAAGKDMASGVKRTFKGEIVGEEYTRWPDHVDFSAEFSKVRAANPDAVWMFYPGAPGIQFFLQYNQSGLKGKVPLYSIYALEALTLPHIGEAAIGFQSPQTWVPDLDNAMNKKFVADFRKRHNRYPTYYSAQAYDSVFLIKSAVDAVKGDLTKKDAMRDAMRKADFDTTRGRLKYGNNHFFIQNFYLQEVIKDGEGNIRMKLLETIYKDHQDPHHDKCPMKW
ncbi:MAG: ABC transporter substrate-binding protein [Rhodospirillales bacterium]|nr:ABC transporter substrate-binding protein [Rhodospirillales bacterium]